MRKFCHNLLLVLIFSLVLSFVSRQKKEQKAIKNIFYLLKFSFRQRRTVLWQLLILCNIGKITKEILRKLQFIIISKYSIIHLIFLMIQIKINITFAYETFIKTKFHTCLQNLFSRQANKYDYIYYITYY